MTPVDPITSKERMASPVGLAILSLSESFQVLCIFYKCVCLQFDASGGFRLPQSAEGAAEF